MKKTVNVLCTLALMSALCAGFVACKEPKAPEPEKPEIPEDPQEVSFYYYGNEKVQLKVRNDRVIAKAASLDEAKALCENEIFIFEDLRWPRGEYVIAAIDPEKTTVEDVRKLNRVMGATYGLEDGEGSMCYPTSKIFVQPLAGVPIEKVVDEAELTVYVKDTELFNPYSGIYLLTLDLNLEHILWASCELFETGLCQYTEPNLFAEFSTGNEQKDEPEKNGTLPVTDIPEEVSAFFEKHPVSSFKFFDEIEGIEPVFTTINSPEEFSSAAPSSVELPYIDFDNYTLVVGSYYTSGGVYLRSLGIDTEPDVMVFNLVYGDTGKGVGEMFQRAFWSVYPKLPPKSWRYNGIVNEEYEEL